MLLFTMLNFAVSSNLENEGAPICHDNRSSRNFLDLPSDADLFFRTDRANPLSAHDHPSFFRPRRNPEHS